MGYQRAADITRQDTWLRVSTDSLNGARTAPEGWEGPRPPKYNAKHEKVKVEWADMPGGVQDAVN